MKILPLLTALALLPVMVVAHGWYFSTRQAPGLQARAVDLLKSEGAELQEIQLDLLDLRLQARAATPEARTKALAALRGLAPLRLREARITLPAALHAELRADRLILTGTLPATADARGLLALLRTWRPDLQPDASALRTHADAQWPEGENGDWQAGGALITPVRELLALDVELEIQRAAEGLLTVKGVLPSSGMRDAILAALPASASTRDLRISPLAKPQPPFGAARDFPAFLRDFFSHPGPRRLTWTPKNGLHLEADALPSQRNAWLQTLRPLLQHTALDDALRLHPSPWHLPGRRIESPLDPRVLQELRLVLEAESARFEGGGPELTGDSREQLASLVPELLAAGPGLRLIIGGHPVEESPAARQNALARARRVLDVLIEAGLPAPCAATTVFEPAGSLAGTVEILLR